MEEPLCAAFNPDIADSDNEDEEDMEEEDEDEADNEREDAHKLTKGQHKNY